MLQVAILAGGLGTRLGPMTERLPKSLVEVAGRPFIDWQLDLLASQGVKRVTVCAGHLAGSLRSHLGGGSRSGLELVWVDEGESRLGTAGALRLALDRGALDKAFFVLFGDSYLEAPMAPVELAWRRSGLPALMTVYRNQDRLAPSNAIYSGARITAYDKARPMNLRAAMEWIDYGLSILTAEELRRRVAGGSADLAAVMRELSRGGQLAGFEVAERFYEVGSREGIAELEGHLASRYPHSSDEPAATARNPRRGRQRLVPRPPERP
ncbi:MAG TPA: sugar phosphate nucleotidyltransferase [Candidatus Dormibacteraeota bacterium]|nr:sugar phosphate nucleotidyltransferase [Candidatus Dormibacteraeota bacterium]